MSAPTLRSRSLRTKIIALSVLVAGGAALMVAWACSQFQARALRESSIELQLALVHDIANKAAQEKTQTFASMQAMGRALTQSGWGSQTQILVAKALLESMPRLDELEVYDAQGRFIDRITLHPGASPSAPAALAPTIQDQATTNGLYLGPAEPVPGRGLRQRWVFPLRPSGQLTGYIASPVRLAALTQHLRSVAEIQFAGVEHALYLADAQGQIFASSNGVNTKASAHQDPLFHTLDPNTLTPGVGIALEIPNTQDPEQKDLATVLRLRAQPWVIVAKVPAKVAFAPLIELRSDLLRSVLAVLAISMVLAFVLARRVSLPLSALLSMAHRLARGRFDHTALLQRPDELGEVARAMNQSVKDLHLRGTSRSKDTREDVPSLRQTQVDFPSLND